MNHAVKFAKAEGYDELWITPSEAVANRWPQKGKHLDAWKIIYDRNAQNIGAEKKTFDHAIPYMGQDKEWNDTVWAVELKSIPRTKIAVLSTRSVA